MLKVYLLVFNNPALKRQSVLDYFDTCHEVKNWFAFMPNAVVIISDKDAHSLQAMFSRKFSGTHHIVTEIPKGNNNGWLAKDVWDFINSPVSIRS
jgi:hypothetical protein